MRIEPNPVGNQPLTEPPPRESYAFVLRHPHWRPDRPYRAHLLGWTAISRDVTHPDGVRAATHFVATAADRHRLWRRGWEDVTGQWLRHLDGEPEPEVVQHAPTPPGPAELRASRMASDILGAALGLQGLSDRQLHGLHNVQARAARQTASRTPEAPQPPQDPPGPATGQDGPSGAQEPAPPPEPAAAPAMPEWTAERILRLEYRQIQQILKDRDLPAGGTFGDLRLRLAEAVGVDLAVDRV